CLHRIDGHSTTAIGTPATERPTQPSTLCAALRSRNRRHRWLPSTTLPSQRNRARIRWSTPRRHRRLHLVCIPPSRLYAQSRHAERTRHPIRLTATAGQRIRLLARRRQTRRRRLLPRLPILLERRRRLPVH